MDLDYTRTAPAEDSGGRAAGRDQSARNCNLVCQGGQQGVRCTAPKLVGFRTPGSLSWMQARDFPEALSIWNPQRYSTRAKQSTAMRTPLKTFLPRVECSEVPRHLPVDRTLSEREAPRRSAKVARERRGPGLEPALFPAGPEMMKLGESSGMPPGEHRPKLCLVQFRCYSDAKPFTIADRAKVHGFHRREIPSGEVCGGVDMYLIPNVIWDNYLSRDIPDLWCGGSHVDWWLTRAPGAHRSLRIPQWLYRSPLPSGIRRFKARKQSVFSPQCAGIQCVGQAEWRGSSRVARALAFDRRFDVSHHGLSGVGAATAVRGTGSREVQRHHRLPKLRIAPSGDDPVCRWAKRVATGNRCAGVFHHRRRLHGRDGGHRFPVRRRIRHFPFRARCGPLRRAGQGIREGDG